MDDAARPRPARPVPRPGRGGERRARRVRRDPPGRARRRRGVGTRGPARFLASAFDCTVTAVDLTPAFVEIAEVLTRATGLGDRVTTPACDVLALPVDDASQDVVWTQHVAMNVHARDDLARGYARALRSGGTLAFYEFVAGEPGAQPEFPVPWADRAEVSRLLTRDETIATLVRAGFAEPAWRDVTAEALAWFAAPPPAPPPDVPTLASVIGTRAPQMMRNVASGLADGRIRLATGVARTP